MKTLDDPIDHLDFQPAIPCEHSEHEKEGSTEPASFYIHVWCNSEDCTYKEDYFICRPCWNALAEDNVVCDSCGYAEPRNSCMKIIDIVKGY